MPPAGDDLDKGVPQYDAQRLPDAHGLVDIESSFSKLVGNKFKAALDLKFLKIVVHVVFGELLAYLFESFYRLIAEAVSFLVLFVRVSFSVYMPKASGIRRTAQHEFLGMLTMLSTDCLVKLMGT